MTYTKCDTKDTLCDDHDDTCVIVLETLEISVIHVYKVTKTHLHKRYPLKPPKLAFVYFVTLHMLKDEALIFFQMGEGKLEKKHAKTLNSCESNMQS